MRCGLWGSQLHDSCCTVPFLLLGRARTLIFQATALPESPFYARFPRSSYIVGNLGFIFCVHCLALSHGPYATLSGLLWPSAHAFPSPFCSLFCYRNRAVSADPNSGRRSQLFTTLCLPKPFKHSQERHLSQQGSSLWISFVLLSIFWKKCCWIYFCVSRGILPPRCKSTSAIITSSWSERKVSLTLKGNVQSLFTPRKCDWTLGFAEICSYVEEAVVSWLWSSFG